MRLMFNVSRGLNVKERDMIFYDEAILLISRKEDFSLFASTTGCKLREKSKNILSERIFYLYKIRSQLAFYAVRYAYSQEKSLFEQCFDWTMKAHCDMWDIIKLIRTDN